MTPTEAVKAKLQSGELMDWKKAWAVSVDRTPQWGHWLLAKLHKNGEIHIAKWQRGDSGPPRPFYRWGSGEDARKPKALTRPAISRRYRKRAAEQDPIKVAARSDLKRLTQRTTPILDPIHAALLGYVKLRGVWVRPGKEHDHKE